MDNKTLEYMGERVDKARKLQEIITTINDDIKDLERVGYSTVRFESSTLRNVYIKNSEALRAIKNEAINALTVHRDSLQHELDEL